MLAGSAMYLVSVIVPLTITVETLAMVGRRGAAATPSITTLSLQLKYWSLYAAVFGAVPSGLTRTLVAAVPLGGLLATAASAALTAELLRDFAQFAQSQDSRVVSLFSKLGDPGVSWWSWLNSATARDESGPGRLFVFGQFTQFCVSAAARAPLPETRFLETAFEALQQWLERLAVFVGTQWRARRSLDAEGYDMLDDVLPEGSRRR